MARQRRDTPQTWAWPRGVVFSGSIAPFVATGMATMVILRDQACFHDRAATTHGALVVARRGSPQTIAAYQPSP